MSKGTSIYTALNVTAIKAIVGDDIYPVVMPQTVNGTAIVYYLSSVLPNPTKDGPSSMDSILVDVLAIARKYTEVDTLSEVIRTAMEAHTSTTIQSIRYQTEQDDFDFETRKYMRIIQLKVRFNR
jgi:hypothetical protein